MWDVAIGEPDYEKVAALIRKYSCEHHSYVTSISLEHLANFKRIAPEIARCYAFNCIKSDPVSCIDTCAEMGIEKIQISDPTREIIAYAHSKGIVCNIYHAEKPEKAAKLLDMGANDYITKPFGSAELLARVRTAIRASRRFKDGAWLPGKKFELDEPVALDPIKFRYSEEKVVEEEPPLCFRLTSCHYSKNEKWSRIRTKYAWLRCKKRKNDNKPKRRRNSKTNLPQIRKRRKRHTHNSS